jgi:hypothetical protein
MVKSTPIALFITFLLSFVAANGMVLGDYPRRIDITTGASGQQKIVHTDGSLWMVDGSLVYLRSIEDPPTQGWDALPQLYRCGPASIIEVRVVARRMMPSDSSWWMFTSSVVDSSQSPRWIDSLRLDATGAFLGPVVQQRPKKSHLLFTPSQPGEPLAITVWSGQDGSFQATHYGRTAATPQAISVGRCGDSLVVIQIQPQGMYTVDVVRGLSSEPSTWSVHPLDSVLFARLTDNHFDSAGCSLVIERTQGSSIDRDGQLWDVAISREALSSGVLDGYRCVVAGSKGATVWRDIRKATSTTVRATPLLSNKPSVHCIAGKYAILSQREWQILQMRIDDPADTVSQEAVSISRGLHSRGTRIVVSGDQILIGGIAVEASRDNRWVDVESVYALEPSQRAYKLDTTNAVVTTSRQSFLEDVRGNMWLGKSDGLVTLEEQRVITTRYVAAVTSNDQMILLRTATGVAIYNDTTGEIRDVVNDASVLAMVAVGDTIVTFRVESMESDIPGVPEARWVADAYDREGIPYFIGVSVADRVLTQGLRFLSASVFGEGIIVNGGSKLFVGSNGAASWRELFDFSYKGITFTTPAAVWKGHAFFWGTQQDTQQIRCWLTYGGSPPRYTVWSVPVSLRTAAPVTHIAAGRYYLVASTPDGLWSLMTGITSVPARNDDAEEDEPFETFDEDVHLYDLLGRRITDAATAPNGWYVAVRHTPRGVRSKVSFQRR